jgi:peptidoglycan hydrolase-like protein with peptidoglycan-binding domain
MSQPTIKKGSEGDAVKIWQRFLGPPTTVDGVFGTGTENATKKWQYPRNLLADGVVGPRSWAAAENESSLRGVYDYISAKETVSPAGAQLKGEFIIWYNGLNVLARTSETTRQEAVNRRNAFDVANVKSAAELEQVKQVIAQKPAVEEIKNVPVKTDSAGNYPKQNGTTVASADKELVPPNARPTIRRGSEGEAVKVWQGILGSPITPDGKFGKVTEQATIAWQKSRGLKADGIVGTRSWTTALSNSPPVAIPFEQAATTKVSGTDTPSKRVPAGIVIPMTVTAKPRKKREEKPVPENAMKASATPTVTNEEMVGISQKKVKRLIMGISLGTGTAVAGIAKLLF